MMTISVAVLLTIGTLLFTLFIRARDLPEPVPVSPVWHLEERKARIYENLRDLQFEYRLGKLSDEDYQKTKSGLQTELAVVLAEIDQTAKTGPKPEPVPPRKALAPNTCPHCAATFAQPMKFCGECGKAMG